MAAVTSKTHGSDPVNPLQSNEVMTLEGVDAGARRKVPDLKGSISGGRDGVAAVTREGHGSDPFGVPIQRVDAGARRKVPDFKGSISGGRDGVAAVGSESYGT